MVSKATAFKTPDAEPTVRLTVAQATIRFLANQYAERDGERTKFFAGCFGIFGHGNVAGIGQALLQAEIDENEPKLRYVLGRNEQAMVHSAAAYARQKDRLEAWVVTASIGPGSTNMLTGAALATINRLPVLLLPSDTFATRVSAPVLQDLEQPHDNELTVNDAFKPLSRFFDRVWRPEQLPSALLGAMRVLMDDAVVPGRPDGAAVDAQGCVWSARYGGGCVARITPRGDVDRIVPLPVSQVASCAFGDDDLRTLYITTARQRLDETVHRVHARENSLAGAHGVTMMVGVWPRLSSERR